MALKIRAYAVVVGQPLGQVLQQAQNEDVQYSLTFTDAQTGAPVDLTGGTLKMTGRNRGTGAQMFQSLGVIVGGTPNNVATFLVTHAQLAGQAVQAYDCDVLLVDVGQNQNQLLFVQFLVTPGVS